MENENVKFLILGAGVSGISAAGFLGKEEDYLVLEKSDEIGGYCKTIKKDGFTWDYSGHFFHFRNDEIKSLVMKNIDEKRLLSVQKKTGIVYRDNIISFPFQRNIHELSKTEFIECLHDYYFRIEKKEYVNFLDWIYGVLGTSIVDKFVKPYNEKLYATSLEKLDVNAMGRFFPTVTLEEIIKASREANDISYNKNFLYPIDGAITYVNSLMSNVDGKKVILKKEAIEIDIERKIVKTNNSTYKYDTLISSIPLNNLLRISKQEFDESLYLSNQVVVFNLGFDKASLVNHHWLYIPQPDICFYRIGFYDNILNEDRASLYVEIGMKSNEKFDQAILLEQVLKDLRYLGLISDHVLLSKSIVVMNPAYIHLSEQSITDAKEKLSMLESKDVYSIGRYGEWTYCSIEDNILSAQECIRKVTCATT
jgi:protoporphyrinogen oxidase